MKNYIYLRMNKKLDKYAIDWINKWKKWSR